MKGTQMDREEVQDFVASLFANGKTPSERFGMTCASLSELERDVIDFNLIGDEVEMKDKFIVVDCMGIKQVGINGDKGVSNLSVDEIVNLLNFLKQACNRWEQRADGQLKALDLCGKRVQELEDELKAVKLRNNSLTQTLVILLDCI